MEKEEVNRNNKYRKGSGRPYISVAEMGEMLGIRKTDRYWLIHKKKFETRIIAGKIWVETTSFEKWYANQVKYRKVTGEEPGLELKEWSYSPRDISKILGICEQNVYKLIRKNNIETVTVDYWKRIPKQAFNEWYESQDHYRTHGDREKDALEEAGSVTMPEMARMLGITRHKVYAILKDPRYQGFFEFVEIHGRKRITKESFRRFLEGQDVYQVVLDTGMDMTTIQALEQAPDYLTIQEAARIAKISRQAMSTHIKKGSIRYIAKEGGLVRIRKQDLVKWLLCRAMGKEKRKNGICQEA